MLGPLFGMTFPAYWLWLLIRQAYGIYEHTGYQVDTTPPFNELWVGIMMNKIMGGALILMHARTSSSANLFALCTCGEWHGASIILNALILVCDIFRIMVLILPRVPRVLCHRVRHVVAI